MISREKAKMLRGKEMKLNEKISRNERKVMNRREKNLN